MFGLQVAFTRAVHLLHLTAQREGFNISLGTGDCFPYRWRLGRKDRKRIRRWAIARGYSSTGRARRSQCRGWGFEPPYLHQPAPVAQRIERRRPKSRVGGSSPSRGTTFNIIGRRSVAQSGQSAGLQNQWSGVRILPLLPISSNLSPSFTKFLEGA